MKKLLAMVLVLGLASVASAALKLDYDGTAVSIVIEAGDALTALDLSVASDVGTLGAASQFAQFTGANVAIAPVAGAPGRYSGAAIPGFGGQPIAGPAIIIGGILPSELPMTVTLTSHGAGTFLNGAEVDAGVVQSLLIPEPITMSLMGLGGLVALRRRRA
jgi:hypothetical protein